MFSTDTPETCFSQRTNSLSIFGVIYRDTKNLLPVASPSSEVIYIASTIRNLPLFCTGIRFVLIHRYDRTRETAEISYSLPHIFKLSDPNYVCTKAKILI